MYIQVYVYMCIYIYNTSVFYSLSLWGIFLSALHDLTLLSQNYTVYLHFTNGETEAQSGYINIYLR